MYLLAVSTFLALGKTLAKLLLELQECLQNLCGCLLNHAEDEMATHTAKCVGSVSMRTAVHL